MNMKEYNTVQALKAEGMSQEAAVKKVLSERAEANTFNTFVRKRS